MNELLGFLRDLRSYMKIIPNIVTIDSFPLLILAHLKALFANMSADLI